MTKRKGIKLASYSLKKKAEIIEQFDLASISKCQFSIDFKIPRGTLRGILKNRDKILSCIRDGTSPKRKKLKQGKLGQSEKEIFEWTSKLNKQGIAVTGAMLKVCFNSCVEAPLECLNDDENEPQTEEIDEVTDFYYESDAYEKFMSDDITSTSASLARSEPKNLVMEYE